MFTFPPAHIASASPNGGLANDASVQTSAMAPHERFAEASDVQASTSRKNAPAVMPPTNNAAFAFFAMHKLSLSPKHSGETIENPRNKLQKYTSAAEKTHVSHPADSMIPAPRDLNLGGSGYAGDGAHSQVGSLHSPDAVKLDNIKFDEFLQDTEMHVMRRYRDGEMLSLYGRHEEALAHFEAIVANNPSHCLSHCAAGFELLHLEKFGEAKTYFRKAILLDPFLARAHYGMSNVQREAQDYRGAAASLKNAAALSSHLPFDKEMYIRESEMLAMRA